MEGSGLRDLALRLASKKAFLWDFDGCFGDTEPIHFRAYELAFAEVGHRIWEKDYYAVFTHLGDGAAREIERCGLACDAGEIMRRKSILYRELLVSGEARLFPEIVDIVGSFRALGAKLAIASNSPAVEIELILAQNGCHGLVDAVVGKPDGLRKKPEPDIFLRAMQDLGATPAECLVFEDSERGLTAAMRAGMEAVWVCTRFNEGLATHEPHIARVTHAELALAARSAVALGGGTPT